MNWTPVLVDLEASKDIPGRNLVRPDDHERKSLVTVFFSKPPDAVADDDQAKVGGGGDVGVEVAHFDQEELADADWPTFDRSKNFTVGSKKPNLMACPF